MPALLGPSPSHELQHLWPIWDPECVQLSRDFQFDFVPSGLFSRFLIHLLGQRYSVENCWRTGALFKCGRNVLSLVTMDMATSTISVKTRGTPKRDPIIPFFSILEELHAMIQHQFEVDIPNIKFDVKGDAKSVSPLLNLSSSWGRRSIHLQFTRTFFFTPKLTPQLLEEATVRGEETAVCPNNHSQQIHELAPELAMLNFKCRVINVEKDVQIGKV